PALGSHRQLSLMEDDALMLRSGPGLREQALDEMAGLGVDVIRVLAVWRDYAPGGRPTAGAGVPPQRWVGLDGLILGAAARGMRVLLTPTGPGPRWASRCHPQRGICDPDPRAFGAFVQAVAERYRGAALPRVSLWSIWNEPNAATWLLPQFVRRGRSLTPRSPVLYRALLRSALAGLNATGHESDAVLFGETAPIRSGVAPDPARP